MALLLTNFSFLINSNSVAVAHYLDLNNESDNDHVPDWYEVRHLVRWKIINPPI